MIELQFRINQDVEVRGLDIYKHGEPAYPSAAQGHGWETEGHMIMSRKPCEFNLISTLNILL